MTLRLPDFQFRLSYGPGDDRLHALYLPALERSVRYDRATGFYSSASLAIASAGIVRLIRNGGRMRFLCGAQLSPADVEAIRRGAEAGEIVGAAMAGCLAEPSDHSVRARLEALAWMVANGTLEIRVVLPRGKDGLPMPAAEAEEYYHPKEGVFVDAAGNKLAFTGSSNESLAGWEKNYESLMILASWDRQEGDDLVPSSRPHIGVIERRFNELWGGHNDAWIAMDIPAAAKAKLLRFVPDRAPDRDPLEREGRKPPAPGPDRAELERERMVFRFLREAPFLPNGGRLGTVTSTVQPWPHQLHVVTDAVARFPRNYLFCDEVGLGKTIEAGLALRELVISGRVRRALILCPKSVLRQWQEELYEKFALNVPRYDGGQVLDLFERELPVEGSIWSSLPILLASSQLAKRRERQEEVLQGGPWDLVIVDESHHARRRDFLSDRFRPNRLLELLLGTNGRPGLRDRTQCIYLLTATPMQIHPVEVWDLLKVLGLGGRWGAFEENFLDFFEELRKPFDSRRWDFLMGMLRDHLDAGGTLDANFCAVAERELGPVEWSALRELPQSTRTRAVVSQLSPPARKFLDEMVRRHTPLRTFLWRNTRRLLRRYKERGLLKENVPHRDPRNEWIALKPDEAALYERIEEYIADFYRRYEAERKGLGFVMTVYRRRLTSSFYAMTRSLERRLEYLKGRAVPNGGLTDDDIEQEDLEADIGEVLAEEDRRLFLSEIAYVEDFLRDLSRLGTDSKLERLVTQDLPEIFAQRETVIIFTQYTDTMDFLRDELRHVYGRQVACYSGRGGEVWDGTAWVPRPKEELKEAFRQGDEIKILLCTESASEGLNLQTCGVLINYDMPWNPMRVEQRIGRIDRIGQRYERVWVRNYFYQGTVEATIYQRLGDRIGWFEDVIGELQPILQRVAKTIERVAMAKGAERPQRLEDEIAELRRLLEAQEESALDLDSFLDQDVVDEKVGPVPATPREIETALVGSARFRDLFEPHQEIQGAHWLEWKGVRQAVTFDPRVFDSHPNSVRFLTYGDPVFAELLDHGAGSDAALGVREARGIGLYQAAGECRLSLFLAGRDGADGAAPVGSVQALAREMEAEPSPWPEPVVQTADAAFEGALQTAKSGYTAGRDERRRAERLALREAARTILVRTALIEIARAQNPGLFEAPAQPAFFGAEVVARLKDRGVPYRGLWTLVGPEPLEALPTDPYFETLQHQPADTLRRRWDALKSEGSTVLARVAALNKAAAEESAVAAEQVNRFWFSSWATGGQRFERRR